MRPIKKDSLKLKGRNKMADEKKDALATKNAVLEKINSQKTALVTRLPKGIDKERFFLGIMTAIRRSKANAPAGKSLAECDPQSVLLAACEAAELGCNLAPSLQLGWLIPYGKEANFQPSYRFFIQKAYETKEVKTFFAEVVYKGDQFDRQYAPKKNLFHAPAPDPAKPGEERTRANVLGAYALIEFTDGTIDWEYLTTDQIERHRNHSKQPNSMKWVAFWEEGYRITPIRVIAKRLPLKNRDFEGLVEAINRDTERDMVSVEDISNLPTPSEPRRLSQTEEPEKAAATTATTTTSTATEQKAQQNSAPAAGSMFTDEDPFLNPAEIKEFWDRVFAAGWKKPEVVPHLSEVFKISAVKDIHKSQLTAVLADFEKPEPGSEG
jgi:recombination protein RecT